MVGVICRVGCAESVDAELRLRVAGALISVIARPWGILEVWEERGGGGGGGGVLKMTPAAIVFDDRPKHPYNAATERYMCRVFFCSGQCYVPQKGNTTSCYRDINSVSLLRCYAVGPGNCSRRERGEGTGNRGPEGGGWGLA